MISCGVIENNDNVNHNIAWLEDALGWTLLSCAYAVFFVILIRKVFGKLVQWKTGLITIRIKYEYNPVIRVTASVEFDDKDEHILLFRFTSAPDNGVFGAEYLPDAIALAMFGAIKANMRFIELPIKCRFYLIKNYYVLIHNLPEGG